jgi:hypothetical protein
VLEWRTWTLVLFVALVAWSAGRHGVFRPRTPADRVPRARWRGLLVIIGGVLYRLVSPPGWNDSVSWAIPAAFVIGGLVILLGTRQRPA